MSTEVPDAALVARVLAGNDRHAFGELVRRHQGQTRALLRRLCKEDHALADDLAQEAFLQAFRKLGQFRADAAFGTWLYRIAYNLFLMHVRSRKEELPLDEAMPPAAEDGDEDASGPRQTSGVEAQSVRELDVRRALSKLSDEERMAIVQCYYLDRSHEEAAYVLGCPVGTVKSYIFRAKKKLQVLLPAWEPRSAS
ncbi:MAG TPA: sigma-70 family RNA polymerase sigma factor [Nevskia sp.]|nr:sigma-70 family RNA polymerase sigma factor [Nevskia sp.]